MLLVNNKCNAKKKRGDNSFDPTLLDQVTPLETHFDTTLPIGNLNIGETKSRKVFIPCPMLFYMFLQPSERVGNGSFDNINCYHALQISKLFKIKL